MHARTWMQPQVDRAKVLSNTIKQKRKEKAGKWEVPLPKVRPIAEDEMFKVLKSGKRMKKSWKRMITKVWLEGEAGATWILSEVVWCRQVLCGSVWLWRCAVVDASARELP